MGQHVHGIKRTAKGELLLILENATDPNMQKYCSILQSTLCESVEVNTLAETVLIEIRDLDEVSIEEDRLNSIVEQVDEAGIPKSAIVSIRKAYRHSQIATLKVGHEMTIKLQKVN